MRTAAPGPLDDDLAAFMSDPRLRDDPYPMYRRLQAAGPIRFRPMRAWLVSRYADVVRVLHHPEASSDFSRFSSWRATSGSGVPLLFRHLAMVRKDPPEHTRIRGLIGGSFGPRLVPEIRPQIQLLADELLDPLVARGEMDLYRDYAYPLPLAVIAQLLGIPYTDFPRFRQMVAGLGARFGVNQIRAPAERRRGDEAEAELVRYFSAIIDERQSCPGDDLLSGIVLTALDNGAMSRDELVANCIFLAGAGHETTARLICNAVVGLLGHPGALDGREAGTAFDRTAVEELCRWEPTVQVVARMFRSDVEVGGVAIPAGQMVWGLLGAANRDEHEFSRPETLDLGRAHNPHLSFGAGIHSCMGAALARVEIEIALTTLFARLPGMTLALNPIHYGENLTLRGPDLVPLRWRPPPKSSAPRSAPRARA